MKKGFTIIELVVTLAIIGIISMVVVASIQKVSKSPDDTVAVESADFLPEPSNYAVDQAGALTPEQLDSLNAQLKTLDNEKHQFAVAIIKTTDGLTIEDYGIKLAEKWKVGGRDTDNGAIIIVATEDRKIRIEVGQGLEGDINDAKAGEVIRDTMAPYFKEGKWYEGISAALIKLDSFVE